MKSQTLKKFLSDISRKILKVLSLGRPRSMGDSSTLRREEGLSSLFMSLYTILGFFLLSSLFHLVSVSARKRLYISEENAVMPSVSLQSASGSSPTCHFCALFMCHSKASISPVVGLCSYLQKLRWDVARRGSVHWRIPVTTVCWEGEMKRYFGVRNSYSMS